jgi:hypothetical protein
VTSTLTPAARTGLEKQVIWYLSLDRNSHVQDFNEVKRDRVPHAFDRFLYVQLKQSTPCILLYVVIIDILSMSDFFHSLRSSLLFKKIKL